MRKKTTFALKLLKFPAGAPALSQNVRLWHKHVVGSMLLTTLTSGRWAGFMLQDHLGVTFCPLDRAKCCRERGRSGGEAGGREVVTVSSGNPAGQQLSLWQGPTGRPG